MNTTITIIFKDNGRTQTFDNAVITYSGNYALVEESVDVELTSTVIPLEYIKQIVVSA